MIRLRTALLAILLGVAACSSTAPPKKPAFSWSVGGDVGAAIQTEYQKWVGTPYRFGGTSMSGVDCSAFVQFVMRDAFGFSLPRATYEQQREGDPVARRSLLAGDLVFFQIGPKQPHVGIYVGDERFVHAASSTGVSMGSLSDSYWKSRYVTAKRVLPFMRAQTQE